MPQSLLRRGRSDYSKITRISELDLIELETIRLEVLQVLKMCPMEAVPNVMTLVATDLMN